MGRCIEEWIEEWIYVWIDICRGEETDIYKMGTCIYVWIDASRGEEIDIWVDVYNFVYPLQCPTLCH